MKKRISPFILVLLIILACSKEEAKMRLPSFEISVVTGFDLRDEMNNDRGIYGTPNVKLGDGPDRNSSKYYLSTFPNPVTYKLNVYVTSPNPASIKNVWIVEAQFRDLNADSDINLGSKTVRVGGAPLMESEFTGDDVRFDVSDFSEGYYRIYLKVGDQLFYNNLIIQ